jgi:hypothetical protein
VDPKPPGPGYVLAPGASGPAIRLPGAHRDEPRLDDHLVRGEAREEMVRGRRVIAAPALPAHGDPHFKIGYVLGAHVVDGYVGSTDLLTRVSPNSDFATDTCIRRAGIDPDTGSRYLEELAFEIVSTQSLHDITERAEDLVQRGVRRLIAIFVKKGEVAEWSAQTKSWVPLPLDAVLEDPTLARPMAIRALFNAAMADNEVVEALAAKGNPRLAEREANARAEGRVEGISETIISLCETLDIPIGSSQRAQMQTLDPAGLKALCIRIAAERRWPS